MRYDKEDIKDPLVSLVVPVYNGEAEIERCLLNWTEFVSMRSKQQ
jgi:hypothetical protein